MILPNPRLGTYVIIILYLASGRTDRAGGFSGRAEGGYTWTRVAHGDTRRRVRPEGFYRWRWALPTARVADTSAYRCRRRRRRRRGVVIRARALRSALWLYAQGTYVCSSVRWCRCPAPIRRVFSFHFFDRQFLYRYIVSLVRRICTD